MKVVCTVSVTMPVQHVCTHAILHKKEPKNQMLCILNKP